jgi:catechol 2,3-dioxygenase-like lactoylglutathione lyase family enzyme
MELVQSRIVTDDVAGLAAFYARLVGTPAALNDYYVEVPAGAMSVGFSRHRFTEYQEDQAARSSRPDRQDEIVLDFVVGDVDREVERMDRLGVDWALEPTTQPWGNRSGVFRDPEGNLVNGLLQAQGGSAASTQATVVAEDLVKTYPGAIRMFTRQGTS